MLPMTLLPEVRAALESGRAVVALESTIITHGMPYPANVETALGVEQLIRDQGAVPATLAIVDGVIRIGLTPEEIEALAQRKDVVKASRRDLAYVVAQGLTGATTVAGTMILAAMAGIRVFVTGGLGGVHRGASETMDVSADLTELGRTPVAVVCAGVKSILDIGLTLEVLETQGVPVVGYRTRRFPAFYLRDGGYPVDCTVETPEAAAALIAAQLQVPGATGMVIANPIPESDALPPEEVEGAIATALADADRLQIVGKAVTPYLLGRLGEITAGRSLKSNIALVRHNATVGAQIAVALAERETR
jgi:pseudouridine-5'-phosphate glycosidase